MEVCFLLDLAGCPIKPLALLFPSMALQRLLTGEGSSRKKAIIIMPFVALVMEMVSTVVNGTVCNLEIPTPCLSRRQRGAVQVSRLSELWKPLGIVAKGFYSAKVP